MEHLNLFDYYIFPNREERELIYNENKVLQSLRLEIDGLEKNTMGYCKVVGWINGYNNTVSGCEIPYLILMNYYKKGVPEYSSNRFKEDNKYKEEDFLYKYYFNYYSEVFLYKIETCFEMMYQVINAICDLRINYNDTMFIRKMKNKLEEEYPKIYEELKKLASNEEYKKIKKLRDLLVHSSSPLRDCVIEYAHQDNSYSFMNKKAISSTEMVKTINKSFELLNEFKNNVRMKIEDEKSILENINDYF